VSGSLDVVLLLVALLAFVGFLAVRLGAGDGGASTAASREYRIRGTYARLLRQAGLEPRAFVPIFWAGKAIAALLVPLLFLEWSERYWGPAPTAVIVLCALLGFFLPDLWVLALRKERRQKITWSLSYFLDLIVAYLRSGLGLEEAFRRAGREGFPPDHPLAREVALVARELDLGKERAAAFHALAERTGVQPMRAIAAALESGLRLGASVEATLRAQAELLRNRRREDTLKRLQLAAVKALFPVVICGLPLFAVIVFYPAVTEIMRTFAFLTGTP